MLFDFLLYFCTVEAERNGEDYRGQRPLFYYSEMIKKDAIVTWVQQKITDTDIFVVNITVGGNNRIFVRVDKPLGISLEECQSISKHIENNLDREAEDFELEVSSPGIGEPFKVIQQFEKCINKFVCVITKEGEKTNGVLQNIIGEEIEIEVEEKIKSADKSKKSILKKKYTYNINNVTVKEIISLK